MMERAGMSFECGVGGLGTMVKLFGYVIAGGSYEMGKYRSNSTLRQL